jgi:hypothetical protein
MRARGSRTQASARCEPEARAPWKAHDASQRLAHPGKRTMRARGSRTQASARCEPEARAPRQAHDASQRLVHPGKRTTRARGSYTQASARCSHKRGRKPAAPDVAPGMISGSTRGWDDQCRKRCSMPLHALRTRCESLHSSHSSSLSPHFYQVVPGLDQQPARSYQA